MPAVEENNKVLNPQKWVSNYADLLYGFTFTRVRSKDLAEDLIQDTFISALKSKDNFKGGSSESTWLISILRNKIIDYYRKSSTKNEVSMVEDDSFFEDDDGSWKKSKMPEPWEGQEETLDVDLFNSQLRNCVSHLPAKNMSVFTLKYLDGESTEDLCKELDITSSNYWVIMHRTKLLLRKCLQKSGMNNSVVK